MSPPLPSPGTIAGSPAPRPVELRTDGGVLVQIIPASSAEILVSRGWADWIGSGRRRHLRMTDAAPLTEFHGRGRPGVRAVRADGTCIVYTCGQKMGSLVEHRS
jgi:hypothetical protein